MEDKKCKKCGKIIRFSEYIYKGTSYESRFSFLKYCSRECRVPVINRPPYKLAKNEHNEKVLEINNLINGEIIHTVNGGEKKYFEDIRKDDICFEVQMLHKASINKDKPGDILKDNIIYDIENMAKHPLIIKSKKWDKEDKHILIVTIPNDVMAKFDGVYLYKDGKLV